MHPGKLAEMAKQAKDAEMAKEAMEAKEAKETEIKPWGVVHNTFQQLAHRSQGRIDFCPVQVRREKQNCCRKQEESPSLGNNQGKGPHVNLPHQPSSAVCFSQVSPKGHSLAAQ